MSEDPAVPEKRAATNQDPYLDWFLRWLANIIANWLLRKLGPIVMRALRRVPFRSVLRKVGDVVWRASPTLALGFGFVFQKNVLAFAGMLSLPRSIGIIGAFAAIALYFHFKAKDHLEGFRNVTRLVGGRCWNVVIGGLSKAFYNLAIGLLPFWQNPWIFVVLGVYSFLILDVVWLKRWFGRAVKLNLTRQSDRDPSVRYGL